MTQYARKVGADASLQVAPYYNKPTQAGLYAHFSRNCGASGYSTYSVQYSRALRCGHRERHDCAAATRFAEAYRWTERGDRRRGSRQPIAHSCDRDFCILSGDDSLTLPMMSVGAVGVISVVSNMIPRELTEMNAWCRAEGRLRAGRSHPHEAFPLFKDLFCETNPIPLKAAMAMMGLCEETYRLPLVPMGDANRVQLKKTLLALGLVKA